MPISIVCRECGKTLRVADDRAGKLVKCGGCGVRFSVPAAGQASSTAAEAQFDDEEGPAPTPARPKKPPVPLARTRYKATKEEVLEEKQSRRLSQMTNPKSQALVFGGMLLLLVILNFALGWNIHRNPEVGKGVGALMAIIGGAWCLMILFEDDGILTIRILPLLIQLLFRLDQTWLPLLLLVGGIVLFLKADAAPS